MSALAVTPGAVNLGQGFPDVDGPREIAEAAVAAIREGRGNQYPPRAGIPEPRQAVAAPPKRFYRFHLDPDTQGAVPGVRPEGIAPAPLVLPDPPTPPSPHTPHHDSHPSAA